MRILFISRLGVACSHLATRLQACSMIDLNKVTCISKLCMFESRTINFTSRKLENYSKNVFSQNEILYAKKIDNFCKITKDQSLSRSWKTHRVGRITSSFAKTTFSTNQYSLSKSFVESIMQYNPPFKSDATDYGKDMEKYARESIQTFLL